MDNSIFKRRRKTFRWPARAAELAKANMNATGPQRTQVVAQLSQLTGNPMPACRRFIERMGNKAKIPYKKWCPKDQEKLLELLDKYTVSETSQQMRCSRRSIYAVLRRLKIGASMRQDAFSKSRLAAVLHVRFYAVDSWIRNGWLKARVIQIGQVRRTVIKPDDFVQFCLKYREVVIGNRLNVERLEFIYKYVFPPDHNYLLSVRASKKERAAFDQSSYVSSEYEDAEAAVWQPDENGPGTGTYKASVPAIEDTKEDTTTTILAQQHRQNRSDTDAWESAYEVWPTATHCATALPQCSSEAAP
jgi:hypothetical protein